MNNTTPNILDNQIDEAVDVFSNAVMVSHVISWYGLSRSAEDHRAVAFRAGWDDAMCDLFDWPDPEPTVLRGEMAREFYRMGYAECAKWWVGYNEKMANTIEASR
jgi:hypothetical protein